MMAGRSIGAVSALVRLSPDALRAWERRYQAISPQRDELGHRLYTPQDVRRLDCLARLVRRGHAIRKVARLSDARLASLVAEEDTHGPLLRTVNLRNRLLDSASKHRYSEFERTLYMSALCLTPTAFLTHVLSPLLVEVGDAWECGRMSVNREHRISEAVGNILRRLCQDVRNPGHRVSLLVATLSGEHHELGALGATYFAKTLGLRTEYLGCDRPAAELAAIATREDVAAVGVSIVYAGGGDYASQLEALRAQLPDRTQLWVGGKGAPSIKRNVVAGIRIVRSLRAFRKRIEQLPRNRLARNAEAGQRHYEVPGSVATRTAPVK